MPLFEYQCMDCGKSLEVLIMDTAVLPQCDSCGSRNLKKQLSAHSSVSGSAKMNLPGPGDTACCGVAPGHADCSGPGSCCGKD